METSDASSATAELPPATSTSSTDHIDAALEGERSVGGLELRPFTFGSLTLAKKMRLSMFGGSDGEGVPDETLDPDGQDAHLTTEGETAEQGLWELSALLWMQSQPVKDVLAHVRNNRWVEEVEAFQHTLDLSKASEYMAEFNQVAGLVQDSGVDVMPKGGGGEDDTPGK